MPSLLEIWQTIQQLMQDHRDLKEQFHRHSHAGVEIDQTPLAGRVAGSNTEVQFNNGGEFGASENFKWDENNLQLILNGNAFIQPEAVSGAGESMQISSGESSGGNGAGGVMETRGGSGNGSGAGGQAILAGGVAGATGAGGDVVINGGSGGATSGRGGNIAITAGSAQDGNSDGGDVTITGGVNTGTGDYGDVILGKVTAINTASDGGFIRVPTMAGTPTGTPANNGSLVYDTTNNKLYIYNGGWKSVTLS